MNKQMSVLDSDSRNAAHSKVRRGISKVIQDGQAHSRQTDAAEDRHETDTDDRGDSEKAINRTSGALAIALNTSSGQIHLSTQKATLNSNDM